MPFPLHMHEMHYTCQMGIVFLSFMHVQLIFLLGGCKITPKSEGLWWQYSDNAGIATRNKLVDATCVGWPCRDGSVQERQGIQILHK